MTAEYPDAIFDPRTKENKSGVVYDAGKKTVGFAEDLTKLDEEVVATQTILGINPEGAYATVKAWLTAIQNSIVKAIGTEIDTGTNDTKFATPKAIKDSKNVPSVAPGTDGNVLTSDGTNWGSEAPSGGGDVTKVDTPVDGQVAVWTGDGTVEGKTALTYDDTKLEIQKASGRNALRLSNLDESVGSGEIVNAIDFYGADLSYGAGVNSKIEQRSQNAGAEYNLDFYVGHNGGLVQALTLQEKGNVSKVGIGITGPTEKLDVVGNIKASGNIELGHATDTTLSRNSAGVLAVEGAVVPTESSVNTLTNKRLTSPKLNEDVAVTTTATELNLLHGKTALTGAGLEIEKAISFFIDGGGSAITTGIKGAIRIPFKCEILEVSLLGDQSGSIVVDIWKDTYANYPPTDADTITSSTPPTISTALKSEDTTLTSWTKSIAEGDILMFNVDSVTTMEWANLIIKIKLVE